MIQYFLYQITLFIVYRLGRQRAYVFARFLANRHFDLSPNDRRAVIANLRHILRTRRDVTAEARQVFQNFSKYLVDFFLMHKTVDERFMRESVHVQGVEHISSALERGKGVIFLTAHIGNWEMAAAVVGRLGHPVTAIALPHKDSRVNALFNRQRESHGVTVVPTTVAVRRCIEALRKNKCVALLGDRDFGSFGEPMSFLGRTTLIPKGAAFFAARTHAAIVPAFLSAAGDRYVFHIEAPILPPDGEGDRVAVEMELMKRYVAVIERRIRENPTQWLVFREFGIEYENLSARSGLQRSAGARTSR